MLRPRATLLVKLLVALVLPVVALFTLFAFVAYEVSRHDLDTELGHRLEAIAASAATQIRDPKYLAELSEGDEDQELFKQAVARLFLIDRQYGTRGDTAAPTPIGSPNYRAKLDGTELTRMFERDMPVDSV